jgi:hypothetical protein
MLSLLRPELLSVVRACPLASVAVGCDRYSVGYSVAVCACAALEELCLGGGGLDPGPVHLHHPTPSPASILGNLQ